MHCDRAGIQALIARCAAGTAVAAALAGCASHSRPAPALASESGCIVGDTTAATRDTIYVVGTAQSSAGVEAPACARATASPDPIVVAESPIAGADLRDVLDRGMGASSGPPPDVVVSRDPGVIAYATSSRDYFTVALPYDRTYVLASADSAAPLATPADRDALARDAVTADARGAQEPFAWLAGATCAGLTDSPPASAGAVVAYAVDDPIARQLAERIVALAAARPSPSWLPATLSSRAAVLRVAAMQADSITVALATGRAAAAVTAFARGSQERCGTGAVPRKWRTVPLIDSRAHAIVRRASGAAFVINADGTLRFVRRKSP